MTKSDNKWQKMTTSDNKWQGMACSVTTNENEWEQIKESDFNFQKETKGQSGSWRILFNFLYNI